MSAPTSAATTWAYRGTDADGKSVTGKMEARTDGVVTTRLRALGISPSSITESHAGTGLNREISFAGMQRRVQLADIAVLSRQMATMIASGLTLLRTLTIVSEQTENKKLAAVLGQVRSDVESGTSLSDAFARHPDEFPPLLLNLIRAGETGGFLERSLESIAKNYEAEVKLRATIKSALTYPVVVLVIALLAIVGMIVFIVPIFEQMFSDLGGELPVVTRLLVALSATSTWSVPLALAVVIAAAIWWSRNRNSESVRRVVEPALLKLPVFGPLLQKVAIARFTRNFATMIGAGVPILQSLGIVGATSGNWVVENAVSKVQESVRNGRSIAAPLAEEPIFPAMVTQMISVGEDSGALEQMLTKVSDFYDQQVDATSAQLTALIEPLMIAVIGVLIGGMLVALYLPVFSIFDQIR
jgi:type IV pilus assembly protein PilC